MEFHRAGQAAGVRRVPRPPRPFQQGRLDDARRLPQARAVGGATSTVRATFDRAFFERYYHTPGTAVASTDDVWKRARFVTSYLDHLQLDVQRVLDAGCGTGLWKRALRRIDRDIEYVGIDSSEYLCRRHGWTHAAVDDFSSRRKFDLVVCQDVLQYVDDERVVRSFAAIARVCRGALYFDVPTRDDIEDGLLDLRRTDRAIHVRSASWYRARLVRDFVNVGGGVFLKRGARAVALALERWDDSPRKAASSSRRG